MKEIKRLSNLIQDKQLLQEMVQVDTWVAWLKHADDLSHLSSGFLSGLGNVVWKGWESADPFKNQPDGSAELPHQQDQGGVTGRFADCFFICSFSSLRNLRRSVRLWRKEVWNGTAEGPLTKGRTPHPRHLLLQIIPYAVYYPLIKAPVCLGDSLP